jgi:DNA-binding NtrC family response regulator
VADDKSRVLLVDDEASILSVLKTLLTVEGYEVVPVQDGRQAVDILKTEDFDIMISDIRMTPVNGMELLKLAHETRPSMAVIMVTAFGSVETAV